MLNFGMPTKKIAVNKNEFKINPNESTEILGMIRINNQFGGFYGAGVTFDVRQIHVKGVAGKVLRYQIGNIDATIIAQAPRMAPHIAAMVANIAADTALAITAVNVKATTTEQLGFTGRGEGIAAEAVCLLLRA